MGQQLPILTEGAPAQFIKFTESGDSTTLYFELGGNNTHVQNLPDRGTARAATHEYEGLGVVVISTMPKATHLGKEKLKLVLRAGNMEWDRPASAVLTIKCGRLTDKAIMGLRKSLNRDVMLRIRLGSESESCSDLSQGMFDPPMSLKSDDGDDDGEGVGTDEEGYHTADAGSDSDEAPDGGETAEDEGESEADEGEDSAEASAEADFDEAAPVEAEGEPEGEVVAIEDAPKKGRRRKSA